MRKLFVLILISICCIIYACTSDKEEKSEVKTYVVKTENVNQRLFFTGTINPIRESIITNPMEGVVKNFNYHYGQKISKNDIVFTINSEALQSQFNTVLTEYLKAKDDFQNAKTKFFGTESLWKDGLVARNTYLSDEATLRHLRITFLDARQKLSKIIEKIEDVNFDEVENLSFKDFEKIRLTLGSEHNILNLKAISDGVLLYPPLKDNKIEKIAVGSSVKAGQALALIGDMSGIRVEIDIPEVEIAKVRPGLPAIVKTTAFLDDELKGKVVAINSQASNNAGAALPTFSAIIEVDNLTQEQMHKLKVGMSAQIEVIVENQNKILIPREAVHNLNGQNMVKVANKDGKIESRIIETQNIENNKVIVSKGLKSGDEIVLS